MKKMTKFLGLLGFLGFLVTPAAAQNANDSALNRSVTVERDFQPVIQDAGKVATKPAVVETTIEPAPVEYSEYTADVTPGNSFHSLLSQPTRFEPGQPFHGYLRAAFGHPNTLFDFGYHIDDGKKSILDVYAHHKAEWGTATLSKTKVGFDFTHPFSSCDLYFGVSGGNIYYTKYGHWYDYSLVYPNRWEKNDVTDSMPPFDYSEKWLASLRKRGYKVYLLSNFSDYNFNVNVPRYTFLNETDGKVISYIYKTVSRRARDIKRFWTSIRSKRKSASS